MTYWLGRISLLLLLAFIVAAVMIVFELLGWLLLGLVSVAIVYDVVRGHNES
jgi:hypothetical protein